MMVKELNSPQQFPTQIIQGVRGDLKPEGTEFPSVEEAITIEAVGELLLDQGLEVQAQVEVESEVKEDVQVPGKETK